MKSLNINRLQAKTEKCNRKNPQLFLIGYLRHLFYHVLCHFTPSAGARSTFPIFMVSISAGSYPSVPLLSQARLHRGNPGEARSLRGSGVVSVLMIGLH